MVTDAHETSIVIRTFNEERFLPALLKAIQDQHYQDYEIIVVDSGSYDRTPHIAIESGARILQIDSRDFTFGYSLNTGIKAARGRFIAIVSAHTEPTNKDWLSKLVGPLQQSTVAMVYGCQLGTPLSKFSETLDFSRTFGSERLVQSPPNFFANNANSAVPKELWEQHPFNEILPGLEDIDWTKFWMEQGFQVIYEPEAAVYHIHQETWSQVQRRYHREAVAARKIGIKSRRHVFTELVREVKYLASDLIEAMRVGGLAERAQEILLFRTHKTIGTTLGLMNGKTLAEPDKRDAMYFDRTCRAVVIHGPNKASLKEIEIPKFKPSEVLIEVAYQGVCATDLEILSGTLGYYKNGLANYPIIPGHEFSGWVARVGANVQHLGPGDPVVVECIQSCGICEHCLRENWIACKQRQEIGVIGRNGGYSEYTVAPARFVHKVPPNLDMKKAALCEPTAVVLKGLKRVEWALTNAKAKPCCAVAGVGPIGYLCAQILAGLGYEVTAFERDPKRLTYLKGSPIKTETSENLHKLHQFDLIVEATGHPDVLHSLLEHSRAGVTLLLLGLPYARREFSFESVVAYEKAIVGSVGSSASDFEKALQLLLQLPIDALLQQIIPFEQYTKAWDSCLQRKHLKTLLQIHGQ
jgi:2-desacetyl-2-hydroxyethyl bacteriochlorophyllide A dehydrogenase